ncbi:MAG: hypothetical protein ABR511_01855 [Acidimicrobiales bacterium]
MANALTHIVPLKEGANLRQLQAVVDGNQQAIDDALKEIGTVHDFRFVFFDASQPNLQPTSTSTGPYALGVITTYDGSFDSYIQDFTRFLAPVFDALLPATVDGAALVPVKDHVQELTEWIRKNDAAQNPPNDQFTLYTAYPFTVQQILAGMG